MIEIPSAAIMARRIAREVDFLSIGTNDLTQYALAAERGNSSVAAVSDPLDPSVLRLIDMVCQAAGDTVPVAVCGEIASEPTAVPLLVGLGVSELSVGPFAVPVVKQAVRSADMAACRALATAALGLTSAAEVRSLIC
jgi:phosphocarrier protein FPr